MRRQSAPDPEKHSPSGPAMRRGLGLHTHPSAGRASRERRWRGLWRRLLLDDLEREPARNGIVDLADVLPYGLVVRFGGLMLAFSRRLKDEGCGCNAQHGAGASEIWTRQHGLHHDGLSKRRVLLQRRLLTRGVNVGHTKSKQSTRQDEPGRPCCALSAPSPAHGIDTTLFRVHSGDTAVHAVAVCCAPETPGAGAGERLRTVAMPCCRSGTLDTACLRCTCGRRWPWARIGVRTADSPRKDPVCRLRSRFQGAGSPGPPCQTPPSGWDTTGSPRRRLSRRDQSSSRAASPCCSCPTD